MFLLLNGGSGYSRSCLHHTWVSWRWGMNSLDRAIHRRGVGSIVYAAATWHDGNRSCLRISGVRSIHSYDIHIASSDDSCTTWSINNSHTLSNNNVARTITIAIVPPKNEDHNKKWHNDKPASIINKVTLSESSAVLCGSAAELNLNVQMSINQFDPTNLKKLSWTGKMLQTLTKSFTTK